MPDENNRIITHEWAKSNSNFYTNPDINFPDKKGLTHLTVKNSIPEQIYKVFTFKNYPLNRLVTKNNFKSNFIYPLGIYGTDINDIVLHQSKLLICGAFNKVNNQVINNLVRLNISDITIDTSFTVNVDEVIGAAQVNFALVTSTDKILLGLTDSSYNQNLICLNADGTLDTLFAKGYISGDNSSCYSAVIDNNKIYTGYTLQDLSGTRWQPYTTNYNNISIKPSIIRSVDINAAGTILYVGGETANTAYKTSLIFVRITGDSSTNGTLSPMPTIPTSLLNTNGHVWSILSTKNTTSYTNLLIGWSDSTGAYITVLTTNETTSTGQKVQVSTNPNVRIGRIQKDYYPQNHYVATMYYYGSSNYETEAIIRFNSNAESVSTSPTITALSKQNIIINGKKVGAIGMLNSNYVYDLISNAGDSSVTGLLSNAGDSSKYNKSVTELSPAFDNKPVTELSPAFDINYVYGLISNYGDSSVTDLLYFELV